MLCPRCHRPSADPGARACAFDGAELVDARPIDLVSAPATPEAGAVLDGRYAIRGLLGKGGMARVFLAEDTATGDAVAVKVLGAEHGKNPIVRERFHREVEVAAALVHPGVARLLDAGEHEGAPYLVLEYLFGESLGDLLRRQKVLPSAFGLGVVRDAAAALGAAHREGTVHRDVKPDNLFLLGEPGNAYAVKVVDFGFAKLREGESTSIGMAIGTLAYMAPEQVLTDQVDRRTDVYGLGVVMYRMFTGRLPFGMRDDAELVEHQLFAPPPRPSAVRAGVDPRVEAIIGVAMSKRPENRYASMDELREDVEAVLAFPDPRCEDGPTLRAARPRPVDPDDYQPIGSFARSAVKSLRRQRDARSKKPSDP